MDPATRLDTSNTTIFSDTGGDYGALAGLEHVRVCSLSVNFGQESFKDGVEISPSDFYARLATASSMPTTAQPSSADMEEMYREALKERPHVVGLHLSEKLSGTSEAALAAARRIGGDAVAVLPTGQVSCGLSLLVREARARLIEGTTLGEIQALVDHFRANCVTLFTLETLEFLQRGGRIGRAQYMAGSLLKVRPILGVEDGEVNPIGKVRGAHRVLPALAAALTERTPEGVPLKAVVGHAQRPEAVDAVAEMVRETRPQAEIEYTFEIGPTVGTHGGPGTLGFSVVPAL